MSIPDVLVVGAGASGCAAASALAAGGAQVVLLEAGLPVPSESAPKATNCDLSSPMDWNYVATAAGGRTVAVPRGKGVGGSTLINTCVALRPDPWSFDAWGAHSPGWGWEDVLPHFVDLEWDADFASAAHHGSCGPLPIVRWRQDELAPPSAVFIEAAQACGHPWMDDLNEPGSAGVGLLPMNRWGERRASADATYLLRHGQRVEVRTGQFVDRVLMRNGRAYAVTTVGPYGDTVLEANHVVLCAGSYGTPTILLRSGIGSPAKLAPHDVPVVLPLAGVGEGLHDHPQVHVVVNGPEVVPDWPALQVMVKTSTSYDDTANDLQLCILNRVDRRQFEPSARPTRDDTFMLCALLQETRSRGTIALGGSSPLDRPLIVLDHLMDAADRARLAAGLRAAATLASAMQQEPYAIVASDRELISGDGAGLEALLEQRVQSAHHPMGSARMGAESDPSAVVDAKLRVIGIHGLSVADASVIPLSINANIQLTCAVIGQRVAEFLR